MVERLIDIGAILLLITSILLLITAKGIGYGNFKPNKILLYIVILLSVFVYGSLVIHIIYENLK
jgi:predicted ferric reductase